MRSASAQSVGNIIRSLKSEAGGKLLAISRTGFSLIRLCGNDIGSYNRNKRYSRYNCIIATTAKCHLYEQQCIQ